MLGPRSTVACDMLLVLLVRVRAQKLVSLKPDCITCGNMEVRGAVCL